MGRTNRNGLPALCYQRGTNWLGMFRRAFDGLLLLPDRDRKDFLDYIAVMALGVFLPRHLERLWGYVCAPASSGKTEALSVLIQWSDYVVAKDYLTPKALISAVDPQGRRSAAKAETGSDDMDPSLLKQLDGKLLIVKEMTTMLNVESQRQALYGPLRGVYDHTPYQPHSGTMGATQYDAKFGVLGATTEDALDKALIYEQAAGERFVCLRIQEGMNGRTADHSVGEQVFANRGRKRSVRNSATVTALGVLNAIRPEIKRGGAVCIRPPDLRTSLIDTVRLACTLRTQPSSYGPASPERLPRLLSVMTGICDIRTIASGRNQWSIHDLRLAKRILWDTLNRPVRKLLMFMTLNKEARVFGIKPSEFYDMFGVPTSFVHSTLTQWMATSMVRYSGGGRYRITKEFRRELYDIGLVPAFGPVSH